MSPDSQSPRPRYDVVLESEWDAHPVLRMLQRGSDVWDNEWHFYFAGFTPEQTKHLKRIELASAPVGSMRFELVEKVTGDSNAIFEEAANVRWYLGDPTGGPRQWVALVPHGFDLDGDVPARSSRWGEVNTNLQAGTLSDEDRRHFLRYMGYDDDAISQSLGSIAWSDDAIVDRIAAFATM